MKQKQIVPGSSENSGQSNKPKQDLSSPSIADVEKRLKDREQEAQKKEKERRNTGCCGWRG